MAARRIFDLERDPREITSLGDDFGDVDFTLQDASENGGIEFETSLQPISSELEEQLRALGYVE